MASVLWPHVVAQSAVIVLHLSVTGLSCPAANVLEAKERFSCMFRITNANKIKNYNNKYAK